MTTQSRNILWFVCIGLLVAVASCGRHGGGHGRQQQGDKVSFIDNYMREYRRLGAEYDAQKARRAAASDRLTRYWAWLKTPEAMQAIAARTRRTYAAPVGFPDTVSANVKSEFILSSKLASAALRVSTDQRSAVHYITLERSDGTHRDWLQGIGGDRLGVLGDGPFDDDEKLAAALLRSNPRPGWPGQAITKTRTDEQEISKRMWEEMTGEKL